ncbi:hypothetical protein NMY22_g11953 [Coprinellus aureogranulatus]|nr:hypothetical protein NMY22_g11953 [Coprinellus aureogranulatus]
MSDTPEGTLPSKRKPKAAEKVKDPANISSSALPSHREARERALEEAAAKEREKVASKQPQTAPSTVTSGDKEVSEPNPQPTSPIDVDAASQSEEPPAQAPKRKKKKKSGSKQSGSRKKQRIASDGEAAAHSGDDNEGVSSSGEEEEEVEVIEAPGPSDATADIKAFWGPVEEKDGKPKRKCKQCKTPTYKTFHTSTLRHHTGAFHRPKYYEWCKANKFASMLPDDRKDAAKKEAEKLNQTTIDKHLAEPDEVIVPYTDALFIDAATEWLIRTNQPVSALEHPSFRNMISVASRCPTGVKIKVPGRKATKNHIMKLFDRSLRDLRKRLNSPAVKGKVSLTCDAWQASNQDAYFAVTGHWIEEKTPGDWKLQNALLGFTLMNTAHDGVRLGRALYQIVKRVGITDKVGWITCDNASNNDTMLRYFASRINRRRRRHKKKEWDPKHNHIRCLAHIINLATQAVLSAYSKAKHYDPASADKYEEDVETATLLRDVVGLIRAIVVKQRSSAKRTEKFKDLQRAQDIVNALVLLLDMKVRWSSTYIMLRRALSLKSFVDEFVYILSREETNKEKRRKIDDLGLSEEEWQEVALFCELLKHADAAQHAFSSETEPVLYNGLPALERLHRAWSSRKDKKKYEPFKDALEAGLAKIEEYYDKTSTSHAYTMAMVLDPDTKTNYFQPNWAKGLEKDLAKAVSRSRIEDDSSDDDEPSETPVAAPTTSEEPWLPKFRAYMDGRDSLVLGTTTMSMVSWWGAHAARLPTWASLARDYLAIMASSVSSERAFSAAGITISKRRNRLKGPLVEALQFLKCAYERDLIFRDEGYTEDWELSNEVQDDDGDESWVDEPEKGPWDLLVNVDTDADVHSGDNE